MLDKLAWRLFFRELRRGELTVISAAIALAVMTVMTLSAVTDRLSHAIEQKSSAFIAADRVLASNHAIGLEYIEQAKSFDLQTAELTYFDTMLFAGDAMQLASVKAVTPGYPLKGELKTAQSPGDTGVVAKHGPLPGEAWLSESVFYSLDIEVGDEVEIGVGRFVAARVLVEEPDASFNLFSSARRVLINAQDIAKTEVIQPGSRVFYRQLFAGSDDNIQAFYVWLKPRLRENQRWYGIKDRRSPISDSVARAERFLLLAGLLGIVLAAVAIAVSARRYCERQYDPVAVMKTLGAGRARIRNVYISHLGLICVFSVTLGLLAGYLLQAIAAQHIAASMGEVLPAVGVKPFVIAIATGLICALMFSLKPLLDLFDIPPLRVLRRHLGDGPAVSRIHMVLSALTIFALMWLFSGNWRLCLILFASSALLIGVLFVIARLLFAGGRKLGLRPGRSWSLALASLQKRANASAVQLISFALAIKLLLFLIVLRADMIADWQAQLPKDAPNAFLVNITEYEREPLELMLKDKGIAVSDFYPVIRGRLNAVNGEHVARGVSQQDNEKEDENARSGVGRELNLTWRETMPSHNELVKGNWFSGEGPEVSIEESMAERLDIKLGDNVSFLIGSQTFDAKVTSFRKVDWSSLKPNFFVILSPSAVAGFPATYMAAVKVTAEQRKAFSLVLREQPTITAIDIDNILRDIRRTIDQVSLAIGFVLVIVVVCGALVLISQVQASLAERMQEIVILRTLGARSSLIRNATMLEFTLLGLLAGLVAALFGDLALAAVQHFMFSATPVLHPHIWLAGPFAGAAFVSVLGYVMVGSTLKRNTANLVRSLV